MASTRCPNHPSRRKKGAPPWQYKLLNCFNYCLILVVTKIHWYFVFKFPVLVYVSVSASSLQWTVSTGKPAFTSLCFMSYGLQRRNFEYGAKLNLKLVLTLVQFYTLGVVAARLCCLLLDVFASYVISILLQPVLPYLT